MESKIGLTFFLPSDPAASFSPSTSARVCQMSRLSCSVLSSPYRRRSADSPVRLFQQIHEPCRTQVCLWLPCVDSCPRVDLKIRIFAGAAGQFAFADPEAELAFAYVCSTDSKLVANGGQVRLARLIKATWKSVNAAGVA